MRRRIFIALLGGAAAWPLAARAQQPAVPVIGFMSGRWPDDSVHLVAAFREGLGEAGFVEGQNVAIEYRWALGHYDRLPVLAAELVSRRVAVLAALGGELSALAGKQATSTIPIVAGIGGDPVRSGLVESISRPGTNVTGYTVMSSSMEPKRLGMLRDLLPGVAVIGVLVNPNFPPSTGQSQELEAAAQKTGQQFHQG
jgi:putative ABC transport system substrate-binding protein